MALIREKMSSDVLIRSYVLDGIRTNRDAIEWLDGARRIEGVKIDSIIVGDLGKTRKGFAGVSAYTINRRDAGTIVVSGMYHNKPFTAGVDMEALEEFIAVQRSDRADIETLERRLGLIKCILV